MIATYRPIGHDWPGQRTPAWQRSYSRFKRQGRYDGERWQAGTAVPWNETLALLDRELEQLEAKELVFQIDLRESDIRLDGQPRADARPADPAVIISFKSKHGPLRYFCDQFRDWHDNVRAIALGLEALRKVERYGITRKGEQYAGWKQLPPGSGELSGVQFQFPSWKEAAIFILQKAGLDGDSNNLADIALSDKTYRDDLFKRAAMKVHPDKGGNRADWDNLVEARRVLESGQQ